MKSLNHTSENSCLYFFYDILVSRKLLDNQLKYLQIDLDAPQSHQLCAKLSECTFDGQEVEFLSYLISKGVKEDPKKIINNVGLATS